MNLQLDNILEVFLLLLLLILGGGVANAQPAISAKSMSMGGSGTAYISGVEATFWNPANLMLSSRQTNFHLRIGGTVLSLEPVIPQQSISKQLTSFTDSYLPYKKGVTAITEEQRQTILNMHFPGDKLRAYNRQRADLIIAGASWQRNNHAFSIALRARYGSNITTGRGWYDERFISKDGKQIRNFSLTQRRSELYELAVGYAQELTFINGLLPGLNKLYIGITPKIVMAGSYFDARYKAQYLQDQNDSEIVFISSFIMESSGDNSKAVRDYLQTGYPSYAIENNLNKRFKFKPTGFGIGFDFGLNYVIPLSTTEKSFRIAFSLNDIGGIRYHKQPLRLSSPGDTTQVPLQPAANEAFIGAEGQFIDYIDQANALPNAFFNAKERSVKPYTALLPASINTGILLDLNRFKFTSDLTLGLNNTAFTSKNIALHVGIEGRPLKHIPIRLGTRFSKELPLQIGFGTGIETKYWDFTVGGQALLQSKSPGTAFSGGAFGGLQLHF